jgi:hypothetical protein
MHSSLNYRRNKDNCMYFCSSTIEGKKKIECICSSTINDLALLLATMMLQVFSIAAAPLLQASMLLPFSVLHGIQAVAGVYFVVGLTNIQALALVHAVAGTLML